MINEETYGVIDTGTSLIAADPSYVTKLNLALGPVASSCNNVEKLPPLTFTIDGFDYEISS